MGKFDDAPQAGQAPSPSPPLDWPDLATKEPPERRWAIRGWLGHGHTTLLVGSGGIGKTLLAQEIGSALALGLPFIDEVTGPLKVLMWACEDDHDELWRRQIRIAAHLDATLDAFHENLTLVPRHGHDNALVTTEFGRLQFTGLERYLAEQINDYQAEVVILDNVAQLYGAGENDRHAVTSFLNQLSGILGNRALLLLAHPSRASGSEFSGSGAWENVARTRLYLGATLPDQKGAQDHGDEADSVRYLSRRKANYSSRDWRRLNYAEGVLVPEAVDTSGGSSQVVYLRELRALSIVKDALRTLGAKGIHTTDGKRGQNYLPSLIMDYKLNDGRTREELASAMRKLILDGEIKKSAIGKDARRRDVFGLTLNEQ